MILSRDGFSLLEVLVAGLIFALAIVPTIGLLTTSSKEVTKVSERLFAVHLAVSVIEEMRSRPVAARANMSDTLSSHLSQLKALIEAFKTDNPPVGATIDKAIDNFTCRATLGGTPADPTVKVEVFWNEERIQHSLSLESRMGV
jgi:Tfp pilus assembly protein PilV